jgi:colanic acid/amylovoran biosynthesis glycosyltransferase
MKKRLAVILHEIWHPGETFIRRHVEELLPGGAVVVALAVRQGCKPEFPVLKLDPDPGSFADHALRLARKLRLSPRYPSKAPFNRSQEKRLRSFLENHGVEVVLGQYMDSSLRFLPVAKRLGVPFYVHAHGYDISRSLRDPYWVRRYSEYNDASAVIVVSESVKRRLTAIGIREEKIAVIPCGVDLPSQSVLPPRRTGTKVLAVGRMVAKKAPLLTLAAFRIAHEARPALRLDFIGHGELLSAASCFVRDAGLGAAVSLLGFQPPPVVRQKMMEADVFVQHSVVDPATGDEEGLPVAILEAMSCRLPVVSTRHAGIPEAVIEGQTGLLVDEGNIEGMAERIISLADNDTMRRSMGDAAWQRAKDLFTWESERASLLRLLKLDTEQSIQATL